MSPHLITPLAAFLLLANSVVALADVASDSQRPNIVIILADDMGYGDVHALNSQSTIPTPHLDRLASEGMTFVDAHSPSGVCTPTRYGLLTGRYCWRTRLTRGVLGGYSRPLIQPGRSTIGSLLQAQGYRTGAVGKWHLGMALPMKTGKDLGEPKWDGDPGVDFAGVISDGPTNHGFDYYFGVSASLDMAPYVYVRNDRFTMQPTQQQPAVPFPHFVRQGPRSEDFVIDQVLDRLSDEAAGFVGRSVAAKKPFFLYLPLTAPHKPAQPHARFRNLTGLGEYADFVAQVDATVGRVLQAIDDAGVVDNTLVIYTSDNGSYMHLYDDPARTDHVDDPTVQGYRPEHHRANGLFRGTKADIWEAGHHVPFFVRWPGRVQAGSRNSQVVCLTDLYATCAEIVGVRLDNSVAEDSCSLLPMMLGQDVPRAAPVIHHSSGGMFAIREGKWKLVLGNGSGGRQQPRGKPFAKPYHLFDLAADIGETTNMLEQQATVVEKLTDKFQKIRSSGRSVLR